MALHFAQYVFRTAPRNRDDDEDDDEEDEEESSEEESEDEGPSTKAPQQELTRTERRELKKKKALGKQQEEAEDSDPDADPLLANPNVVVGKTLAISDLGKREPSRRERFAVVLHPIRQR